MDNGKLLAISARLLLLLLLKQGSGRD